MSKKGHSFARFLAGRNPESTYFVAAVHAYHYDPRHMEINVNKLTYLSGFLGSLILVICCTVPAIPHPIGQEAPFSFLNHFMSELGCFKSSKLALVYNSGIFIGGFLLSLFMIGLGHHFRTRLGYAASVCGGFAGFACGLLGYFPLNRLVPHLILAYAFFIAWPVSIGLFSLQVLREPKNTLSRGLLSMGMVSISLFVLFLAMPFMIGMQRIMEVDLHQFVRPPFIFTALLEWLMCLSVFIWVVLASIKLVSRPPVVRPPDLSAQRERRN